MDIHEHQAKELLRQYDIPTPSGYVAFTIDEAIKASTFLSCNRVLGYHFDTFDYIKIDHKKAFTKFSKAKKELTLLPVGGNLKI